MNDCRCLAHVDTSEWSTRRTACATVAAAISRFLAAALLISLLNAETAAAERTTVRCEETDEAITIYAGEQPMLRYHKAAVDPPPGIDPVYRRSGYIHPIWSPRGQVVTGDFAVDHPHQHGLFFAYVDTTFGGQKVDFWNQAAGTGEISHRRVLAVENGDGFAQFQVELVHHVLPQPGERAQPTAALLETWTVRAAAAESGQHQFDIEILQRCAADIPLVINEYHYGGLGIRGSNQWYRAGAAKAFTQWQRQHQQSAEDDEVRPPGLDVMGNGFLTSALKQRHDGNHTKANWVSIFGTGDESGQSSIAGLAVLSHPSNFRAPQPVRLNPSKPYFCFAPMVQGQYDIVPQQPLRSRYRFIVHDGPPDARELDAQYEAYAR